MVDELSEGRSSLRGDDFVEEGGRGAGWGDCLKAREFVFEEGVEVGVGGGGGDGEGHFDGW